MLCLYCRKNKGKPKFCSTQCEEKARRGFNDSIDRLKRKPMPWGGEKIVGSGDLW